MSARNIALNWSIPAFATSCAIGQGESVTLTFTAVTTTAITGWTLTFTCKRFHTDTAALFTLTPTITDGVNGVFTVSLTPAQTTTLMTYLQSYCCDVWRTDSGSETLLSQVQVVLGENPRVSI